MVVAVGLDAEQSRWLAFSVVGAARPPRVGLARPDARRSWSGSRSPPAVILGVGAALGFRFHQGWLGVVGWFLVPVIFGLAIAMLITTVAFYWVKALAGRGGRTSCWC